MSPRLIGGTGIDRLTGGRGTDLLTGGTNSDRFIFNAINESGVKGGKWTDKITDFGRGDKITLTAIDANELVARNQRFRIDADDSFSTGEIRQVQREGYLRLEFNVDGDDAADMAIHLTGRTTLLTATDFQL